MADRGRVNPWIYERAILVVGKKGEIYGQKEMIVGEKHHTTPVAGEDVLFAGTVETDKKGRILSLDYNSGHYKPGPYSLKIFIDDLGGPEKLPQVRVGLSDLAERDPMRSQNLTVEEFYRNCLSPKDSGENVLFRFLLREETSTPGAQSPSAVEGLMENSIRAVYNGSVTKYLKKNSSSSERELVLKKLTSWVDFAYNRFKPDHLWRITESIYRAERFLPTTDAADFALKSEFYQLLFKKLPKLKSALEEENIKIDLGPSVTGITQKLGRSFEK